MTIPNSRKRFTQTETAFSLKIFTADRGMSVDVYQFTSLGKGLTWRQSSINWGSPGGVDTDTAADFAECVLEAIRVAREWDAERAGKPVDLTQH